MSEPVRQQTSGETILRALDVVNRLGAEASVTSVGTATLTDLTTGQAYAAGIVGASSVVDTEVRQKITALQPGRRYRLTIPFTDSDGNIQEAQMILECAH